MAECVKRATFAQGSFANGDIAKGKLRLVELDKAIAAADKAIADYDLENPTEEPS